MPDSRTSYPGAGPSRPRYSLRSLFVTILVISVLCGGFTFLATLARNARRQALALTAQGSLNQLMLALHNYHDIYGSFPPAYLADAQGRPMHSWRILILPFVEERELYQQYDFNEPWDGPNNSQLAARIPRVFQTDRLAKPSPTAHVLAVVGPSTAFPGATSTCLADFHDGTENTILLVESVNSGVHWMEPRDLDLETVLGQLGKRSSSGIAGPRWRRPWIVFADRITGYRLDPRIPAESLRALLTIDGRERVDKRQVMQAGHVSH